MGMKNYSESYMNRQVSVRCSEAFHCLQKLPLCDDTCPYIFKIFDLFFNERERERDGEREAEGEAGSLDPGSPGSHLGLKAVLNL